MVEDDTKKDELSFGEMLNQDFKEKGIINENKDLFFDSAQGKIKIGKAKVKEYLNPNNVQDYVREFFDKTDLANKILKIQPMYYDNSKMWWAWDEFNFKWEIRDETDILNFVTGLSVANTVKSQDKYEILEAIKQKSRLNKPKDMKKSWVQFKDLIVDVQTGKEIPASPKYFITNPVPYPLHHERYVNTPIMDKLFEEWVGEEQVKTLYQIIAYCLIPDYPIHRLFCFVGSGLNGKSCFLKILKKFVGKENVTSTELDTLLTSRFEVTRLHKKLVCVMGETNFAEMSKTSVLKKLTGGDVIGFEYKNKNPFEAENYAKIIIATNNLPTTSDKTIGFYRRWLIIDFPNTFSEKSDILGEIPEEEYEILAVKSLIILKDLLDEREFHNEGSIQEREQRYEDRSDPLVKFINEFTDNSDPNAHIPKWEFEKRLGEWLTENRHRKMSDKSISRYMRDKGYEDERVTASWYENDNEVKRQIRAWLGIKWK